MTVEIGKTGMPIAHIATINLITIMVSSRLTEPLNNILPTG